jgi:hypothetical protein
MAKRALVVTVRIEGVREILRALTQLPKDAQTEIRDRSAKIAAKLAPKAAADIAAHGGRQGPNLATTVKVVRDRVPAIQAGGSRRLGRHRAPAYGILFGSIFGMTRRSGWYASPRYGTSPGRQYRPHRGQDAYAFFPIADREAATISREWNAAADEIVRKFGKGGA